MLVKHGASWDSQDYSGSTALHWAVDGGNIEVVRWLLKKGCQVDVKDYTSGKVENVLGLFQMKTLSVRKSRSISTM